jgi:vitamin B12 transporter
MNEFFRLRARVFTRLSVSALFVLSLACTSVNAQNVLQEINPLVVVGSRVEQPLQGVLPSVSVIQRFDIEKSQAGDLSELLMGQPGMEFSRSGGPGSPIFVYMRGASSTQTLVLVDGIPFSSEGAIGGSSPLETIPMSQIERIEILRGNASALYGPGAMGGVIQIYTRQFEPNKLTPYASVTYGRYNTSDVLVGFGTGTESTKYNLSVGKKESKGFEAISHAAYPALPINPSSNGFKGDHFSFALDHIVSSTQKIGFKALQSETLSSFDNPYANSADERWSNNARTQLLQIYSNHRMSSDWQANFTLSQSNVVQRTLVDALPEMHYGTLSSTQNVLRWNNIYAINASHVGSFGYEFKESHLNSQRNDWVTDERLPLIRSTQKKRAYAGLTSSYGRISTQTNLSYEMLPSGVNGATYLLGAGYQINPTYKATMTRSTAIQSPTVGQLNDVTQGGNGALGSEKSTSTELGLQFADKKSTARAVLFVVNYDKLIASGTAVVDDPYWGGVQGIKKLVNVNNAHNTGVELSATQTYDRWRFDTNLTHQTLIYENTTTRVLNKSRNLGSVDVSYALTGFTTIGGRMFATSSRSTYAPNDVIVPTAGYGVMKIYMRHKIDDEWSAGLMLDNVFNREYFQVAGFSNPGRSVFVNLAYRAK